MMLHISVQQCETMVYNALPVAMSMVASKDNHCVADNGSTVTSYAIRAVVSHNLCPAI